MSAGAAREALQVRLQISVEGLQGALNRISATVSSAPRGRCSLTVSEAGRTRSFIGRRPGRAVFLWTSRRAGRLGAWQFQAICRAGARWGRWTDHVEPGLPQIGGAFVSAPAIAGAQPSPAIAPGAGTCDSQGICFAADPFPAGECTWYALGRRPDLAGIVQGDAWKWWGAAAGKATEGHHPVAGALAVWAPNSGPAGPVGHVAYVAQVRGGRLLVDDSNWRPTPASPRLQVHEHWVPARSVEGYIYPPHLAAG